MENIENYEVSREMQSEAERMVLALVVSHGDVKLAETFLNEFADKYSKDQTDNEKNKAKEYLRRKILNSKVEGDGNIILGNANV